MSDRQVSIVEITATGAPVKVMTPWKAYHLPVTYHLADGRVLKHHESFRLLRDAKTFATTLPAAPRGPRWALFNEAGEWTGTRMSITVGGRNDDEAGRWAADVEAYAASK